MPLYRPTYDVEYDPSQPTVRVSISSGDMMRAELEAAKLKLPERAPFHVTALWLWSALVRLGTEQRRAAEFIADPPEWQPVKDAAGEPSLEPVDPTQDTGASDSSLPVSTGTPDSGLTPS
jgi:hypothetical protein